MGGYQGGCCVWLCLVVRLGCLLCFVFLLNFIFYCLGRCCVCLWPLQLWLLKCCVDDVFFGGGMADIGHIKGKKGVEKELY